MVKRIITRFRAYQLGTEGSSFSYFADDVFTLIEARLTNVNSLTLNHELVKCEKQMIDTLHITSWDKDHCAPSELEIILKRFKPKRIEYPGYEPHTDTAKESFEIIKKYKLILSTKTQKVSLIKINPAYINSLKGSSEWGYKNIFYNPKKIFSDNSNDNSTVKFFRTGSFNVVSLGDVENKNISSKCRRSKHFQKETDILILPHHGANNGFISSKFLKVVKPTLVVCSSNYDNKYDHPDHQIRNLLNNHGIPLYTTKTGDVLINSIDNHERKYCVYDLISNSEEISSADEFESKKYRYLNNNPDTVRNFFSPKRKWPKPRA